MNTIPETISQNGADLNLIPIRSNASILSSHNVISSSSSTSTSSTNGHTFTSKNNSNNIKDTNGNTKINESACAEVPLSDEYNRDLKIIGHIKDFKVINEKRRVFLANTISECSTDDTTETATKTERKTITETGTTANNGFNEKIDENNEVIEIFNEKRKNIRKHHEDINSADAYSYVQPLRSPMTPPPKPPMLSRTRSLGVGDNRYSLNENSPNSPISPMAQASVFQVAPEQNPVTSTTITTVIVPEPVKVTTVQLKPESPVLLRVEQPTMSTSLEDTKQISAKHYEHLIEELKCPGCAYPMKAPILLCQTGHSICKQCTRVLMLCPLCKEPFTDLRSITVEALCSKAHFRCSNAAGGCTVRLQLELLSWHEKQCVYKPMKCFMGRVWGDCDWSGCEINWKEHLEANHANKVFATDSMDLIWNMGSNQKPLTGYYVFQVFDEMFNFYEVHDRERVLFTMTCTSTIKEKKHNFAYEVTMINQDNEALAITQKFPVHSEYDRDILAEGTCVSIPINDLAKFIDDERLLHYRVRVLEVKSPRKSKLSRNSSPNQVIHPIDFQQTQIEGVNLKNVPSEVIVTRKLDDIPFIDNSQMATPTSNGATAAAGSSSEDEMAKIRRRYNSKYGAADSNSDSDPESDAFIQKKWGTPQLHFNRKYLKTTSTDSSSNEDAASKNNDVLGKMNKKFQADDKISIASTNTSYTKKVTNTLRKSFRSLKSDISEMKPFSKKSSPEKKSLAK